MTEWLAGTIAWILGTEALKFTIPHCALTDPELIRVISNSNFSIGLVYLLLSIGALERFFHYRDRIDIQEKVFLLLFAAFVSCCGMTHWMRIYTLWYPGFIYEAWVLDICEVISWLTFFAMIVLEYRKRREPTKKEFMDLAQQIKEIGEKRGISQDS